MSRVRAHGTRVGYLFGVEAGARGPGCRCDRCREANAAYKREWRGRRRPRRRALRSAVPVPVELLADAVCRADDVRTEVFYPMPSDVEAIEVAKAICAGCPVRIACLEYAVDHFEQHGVWGGTTPDERVEIRKASA